MRHDSSIPTALHAGTSDAVKSALGAFWSSVFADQGLVDGLLEARVLSACQKYIDAMEALSLRDHGGMPVFHREHWHPVLVRLSERNTASPLVVGMRDMPVLGPQAEDTVYLPDEVFEVGGNALYSKVNTYPLKSFDGCRLVAVRTGLFDSISHPRHILSQGRDFDISGDVLVIRKEHDPFDVDGYRIVEDEDDRVAVLWACDAEYDTDNVRDFLAYPLGFDVDTSPAAARMLSALWDTVVYGLTPRCLNSVLGALFDVPVVPRDTVVESVEDDEAAGTTTVVTSDDVYVLSYGSLLPEVKGGARLHAGDFLVRGITVRHGLSKDEVAALVDDGVLTSVSLPAGSVAGVDGAVVVESRTSVVKDGGWFKLSDGDSADSPFWAAVRGRVSAAELEALAGRISVAADPSEGNSRQYTGPIAVDGPVTIYARAFAPGLAPSRVVSAAYTTDGDATPVAPVWATAELVDDSEWAPLADNLLAGRTGTADKAVSGYGSRDMAVLTNGAISHILATGVVGFLDGTTATWEFASPSTVARIRVTSCHLTGQAEFYDDIRILRVEFRMWGSNEWVDSGAGGVVYAGSGIAGSVLTATLSTGDGMPLAQNAVAMRIAFDRPVNMAQYYAEIEAEGVSDVVAGEASAPVFRPGPGVLDGPQSVSLSCITDGAAVYYSFGQPRELNPLKALGYLVLANTILVESDLPLSRDPCAAAVFTCLQRLVPAYASLLAMCHVSVDEPAIAAGTDDNGVQAGFVASAAPSADAVDPASDSVACTMVPLVSMEV